jgi:hypothetical protein
LLAGFITMESMPLILRVSTWYLRLSATFFSLPRLPCSYQNLVMSIRPAGLAACHRQTAPTNVL